MKKKYILVLFIICAGIPLLKAFLQVVAWLLIAIAFSLDSHELPEPVITYGEFPFRLEYKINGETVVVEDVIICEYHGVSSAIGSNSRLWSKKLKNKSNLVIFEDDNVRIICDVGTPEYYMGDPEYITSGEPKEPYFYIYNNRPKSNTLNTQQLIELYKIELVDAKFSEPIENSFKDSQGHVNETVTDTDEIFDLKRI